MVSLLRGGAGDHFGTFCCAGCGVWQVLCRASSAAGESCWGGMCRAPGAVRVIGVLLSCIVLGVVSLV
jgi:hypothetical protein